MKYEKKVGLYCKKTKTKTKFVLDPFPLRKKKKKMNEKAWNKNALQFRQRIYWNSESIVFHSNINQLQGTPSAAVRHSSITPSVRILSTV